MPWLITRTLTMTLSDEDVERERMDDETPEDVARTWDPAPNEWHTCDTTVERLP